MGKINTKKNTSKITTLEMELALMTHFKYRQNVIIPNISWGLQLHECDLLVVRKSLHMVEVEIKVTKSDLMNDFKKKHSHLDKYNRIREFYYAMPRCVFDSIDKKVLPIHAGIIVCDRIKDGKGRIKVKPTVIKPPKINTSARKLTEKEYLKVLRLGAYRIYTLKSKLQRTIDKYEINK